MSFLPVGVYGLEVPAGEILVPASRGVEAHFRITMAAIDPSASPVADSEGNIPEVPRSTLKLIRMPPNFDDEEDDEEDFDEEAMEALLNGSDDEEDSEDENGGPSDPSKSKKSARAAALAKLIQAAKDEEDEEMEDAKPNKGKGVATESDEESDEEEDPENEPEEFVICTLDTQRNFQQPIDIHISEGETVFFVVSGTHNVYLTGNYVIPPEDDDEDDCDSCDENDEDYELPEGMEDDSEEDSEVDELDDLAHPRVTEIESEDEAPKLVDTSKKSKKRAAEENLDEMIKSDDKTKKQKNNQGKSVAAAAESKKGDKKVQFAKQLEQGPTPSADAKKADSKPAAAKAAPVSTKKVVQGVTVDDRKTGAGRAAKKGDTVGMRYIGKLDNGKVFDANKKGKPFYFKLGKGEVIKGWDIGVAGMAIGGERRLTIPAPLAYGSKSLPGIPGNSQLTFDVKLLEIK
ncbi:hypothetical protein BROUX41_000188 [Berkeleyomyces rouxiae]|uniref:uncharacterized protein n=1 Tax=Berkeleyomyces rouxiae TaxID=2035830 RepID=UPI003B7BA630